MRICYQGLCWKDHKLDLTHKIAISLSLMRIYVLYFSDVYHCPNLKLTHKSALKSRLQKFINFSLKRVVICLFRRRDGSKWRAYESKLNILNVNDLLTTRINDVVRFARMLVLRGLNQTF